MKSFTLIESLIAIFILTSGILAVFGLISSSFLPLSFSSKKLVAAYLAQEGIEIVRNIRDTNLIQNKNWDENLSHGTFTNFDYRSESIPDNTNCQNKNYLTLVGEFYQCSTSSPNSLKREISITKSENVLEVRVTVSWKDRRRSYQLTAQENLYNWR